MSAPQEDEPQTTMAEIDNEFQQLACLGHGAFGSVFLAKKRRSGRLVALKFTRIGLDDDDDEAYSSFTREVDAVLKLDCADTSNNKDMAICYFQDWFRGPNFACIVMQHANGGTLSQDIDSKTQPYAERRIAWYALQLSEALAHAHSRGVAHHDVKASNVLIDNATGGKLLLADFGSAVSPGEEGQTFTKLFASPELQAAWEREDFSGLDPERIDAFGLGCIMFELICCKRLAHFPGMTLGEHVGKEQSADAALLSPAVCLPWAQPGSQPLDQASYSCELGCLIKSLLEPLPANRTTPSSIQKSIRGDQRSPLLADFCTAAVLPEPGAALTIDNIQLGMFVQRGRDWNDGDADGGQGCVGVVVRMDPDGQYTEVAFPSRTQEIPKPITCRIGAGNKFELQVGPTPINDFIEGSSNVRKGGMIYSTKISSHRAGHLINHNCMTVYVDHSKRTVMFAPMEKISISSQEIVIPGPIPDITTPRRPMPVPDRWNIALGLFLPIESGEERSALLDMFYSQQGGMNIQLAEIISIQATQPDSLWESFAAWAEEVAKNNWSNPNEKRLFHGTGGIDPEEALLRSPDTFNQSCALHTAPTRELEFSTSASFADGLSYRSPDGITRKIVVSRVALGRSAVYGSRPAFPAECHSLQRPCGSSGGGTVYSIPNQFQACPEFIITYKVQNGSDLGTSSPRPRSQTNRPIVRARRPRARARPVPSRSVQRTSPASPLAAASGSTVQTPPRPPRPAVPTTAAAETSPAGTKMCVICWDKPVCMVLVPCGHPCLCEVCSTRQGLHKIKRKCPECRTAIAQVVKIFGRVAED